MWKSVCPKWLAPKTMVNCGAIVVPFAFILIPQNRSLLITRGSASRSQVATQIVRHYRGNNHKPINRHQSARHLPLIVQSNANYIKSSLWFSFTGCKRLNTTDRIIPVVIKSGSVIYIERVIWYVYICTYMGWYWPALEIPFRANDSIVISCCVHFPQNSLDYPGLIVLQLPISAVNTFDPK